MTIAHVGSLGESTVGGAGLSTAVTLSAIAEAGNLVVVAIKIANVSLSSGVTNDITSITDSAGGNTWVKAGEYTQTAGGASDGSTTAVFYSRLTNQIASNGTITITHTNAGSRAIMAEEYTVGGALTAYGTTQTTGAAASTNPGSLSVSGLVSAHYMGWRAVGMDENTSITGGTASWTALTGAAGVKRSVDAEHQIATATAFTSAPTLGTNNNSASVMFVISDAVITQKANGLFMCGTF